MSPKISVDDLKNHHISVREPFAEFLQGTPDETSFDLSLLDVVRFAGHACPSMVGAFLISQRVVRELFPDTGVCVRGEIRIEIPAGANQGATGPIANVFGFIFGAWEDTGFGGLNGGRFARRGLLRFNVADIPPGTYRFRNERTGAGVDIVYDPNAAPFVPDPSMPFQEQWRHRVKAILDHADRVIQAKPVSST
jgi:hypothetical protein